MGGLTVVFSRAWYMGTNGPLLVGFVRYGHRGDRNVGRKKQEVKLEFLQ